MAGPCGTPRAVLKGISPLHETNNPQQPAMLYASMKVAGHMNGGMTSKITPELRYFALLGPTITTSAKLDAVAETPWPQLIPALHS